MRFHEFTADTPVRTISGRTGRPVDMRDVQEAHRQARRASDQSRQERAEHLNYKPSR